jgi:hypothetical protein
MHLVIQFTRTKKGWKYTEFGGKERYFCNDVVEGEEEKKKAGETPLFFNVT